MFTTDLRHAFRGLLRMPGFALICVITLALGIGATTAIFSAIYHTMLRPMPFPDGDRLAYVWVGDSASGMQMAPPSTYIDAWRGRTRSFDGLETYSSHEFTLLGGTEPELVKGAAISQNLPLMLGVSPVIGRTFTDEEMARNAPDVAVISESLWKRRFGGSRDALGKQLALSDGKRYQIVGVMPNMFSAYENFQHEGQLWIPLRRDTASSLHDQNVIARLKAGVTEEAANAELGLLVAGVKGDEGMPGKWAPKLMKPQSFIDGTTQTGLPILFVAVAAVLLIGCANIAGLLLVRLNYRRRELAIRAAVGARRFSILRLLALESILLALAGGALGILLSSWLTNAIRAARPENLNSLDAIRLDGISLVFALVLSVLTAVFFGIAPAIAAMRKDLADGLLSGAGSSTRVTSGNRVRSIMVGGQIALSCILLIASLLLVRSVQQLQQKDLGFDGKNVLTFRAQTAGDASFKPDPTRKVFIQNLEAALRKLPGVTSVSVSTSVPSKGGVMFGEVTIPGRVLTAAEKTNIIGFTSATPDYVKTVGLRLREGRFYKENEEGNPVVINESWAKLLWPKQSALGKQFVIGTGEPFTVIGVVEDVATMGPATKNERPSIYTPFTYSFGSATYALRTDGRDPASLTSGVRAAVRALDPSALTRDVATLEGLMADTIALDRFYMMLLGSFAGLALLLSVIGLYGVISNTVAQRTREIGVRMALGATPGEVRSLIFGHSLRIVGLGLALGTAAAMYLVRFIESALHGFSTDDPLSYVTAMVVLAAGATFATWVPARRAVRVDPLQALRSE